MQRETDPTATRIHADSNETVNFVCQGNEIAGLSGVGHVGQRPILVPMQFSLASAAICKRGSTILNIAANSTANYSARIFK